MHMSRLEGKSILRHSINLNQLLASPGLLTAQEQVIKFCKYKPLFLAIFFLISYVLFYFFFFFFANSIISNIRHECKIAMLYYTNYYVLLLYQ